MPELPPVRIELIADAKRFTTAMKQGEASIDSLANKAEARSAALKRFGDKFANATIAGAAAIGVASIKMAVDFETAVTRLETGAGEAHKNIELVKQGMLEMAGQVGKTPKELAEGLYLIESAGFHGAQGLKVLKASAQGAAVGGAEMGTVADAVTTLLNNYNMSADQASTATSALVQTVALGKTTLQEFASSLGKVLPAGAALHLKFQDVAGAMATMTATGLKAELAAERLNAMMLGLATPTTEAAQVLQYIGLTADQVITSMGEKGLAGTIQMLEDHLGKKIPEGSAAYVDAMQQLTGGQTGYTAALMLTGSHMQTFKNNTDAITETMKHATTTVQGFNETQKTTQQKWNELKGALQSGAIAIGDWLLPKVNDIIKWAQGAMEYFKKHPLIKRIATDAALSAFGVAIGLKIKKAFMNAKDVLGFGKATAATAAQGANTTALDLNTAALNRLTIAMGGTLPTSPVPVPPGGGGGTPTPKESWWRKGMKGAGRALGLFGLAYSVGSTFYSPEDAKKHGMSNPYDIKGNAQFRYQQQYDEFIKSGGTRREWIRTHPNAGWIPSATVNAPTKTGKTNHVKVKVH